MPFVPDCFESNQACIIGDNIMHSKDYHSVIPDLNMYISPLLGILCIGIYSHH